MKDAEHIGDPPNLLSCDGFVFTINKKIGEGGFARCYEAIETSSSRKFAIKAIHVEEISRLKAKNKLLNELDIHYKLDHRYIVKLYKVFQDHSFIYMILELCENKTMVELLRSRKYLPEPECRQFLWMILLAIHYLHERNIIHRDLKLSNIFLNLEYDVKIGDFGLATTLDQVGDRKKTICGTPNYIAPEILFDKERGHSFEVDIWSFGVVMYSLLFGRPPFQNNDVRIIYKNIKENHYAFPEHIQVSDSAKELIALILTANPDKRPKLDAIASHSFFKQVLIKESTHMEILSVKMQFQTMSINSRENSSPNQHTYHHNTTDDKLTPSKEKRISIVELVYRALVQYFSSKSNISVAVTLPTFYIEKWIDYTNKYGIGYRTNTSHIGAYFNDSTSMILNSATSMFEYQYQETSENHKQVIKQQYSLDDYPTTLTKKITILKHFQSYLMIKNEANTTSIVKIDDQTRHSKQLGHFSDCMVKYAKFGDTFIFRLSNRIIQAAFPDHMMLIMSQEGQVVTISHDVTKSIQSYALSQITDPIIVQKLDIFKGILESLLGIHNHTTT